MKTIYKAIIALCCTAVLTTACESEFLDEKIHSFITMEDFYQTDADYTTGLMGVYDMLGSSTYLTAEPGMNYIYGTYSYGYTLLGDCGTDLFRLMVTNQVDLTPLETYDINASSAVPLIYWAAQYIAIARANALISSVPENETSRHRLQCKAEAVFLRALFYFNLSRVYGGVPLTMEKIPGGTFMIPVREPVEKVIMANIVALEGVLNDLPASTYTGRAVRNTGRALLAKMYLHLASMKRLAGLGDEIKLGEINSFDNVDAKAAYEKARDYAGEALLAISAGNPLMTASGAPIPYSDSFYPKESSIDLLLDAQFSCNWTVEGSFIFRAFGPQSQPQTVGGGGNFLRPLWINHYQTYDANDARYAFNISVYNLTQNATTREFIYTQPNANQLRTWMAFAKFKPDEGWGVDPIKHANNNSPINVPILRVAELSLIYAEALAEIAAMDGGQIPADAYKYLNYVRERSRKTVTALPDITQANLRTSTLVPPLVNGQNIMPGGGTDDINYFRIALLNERKWELCGEGNRIYDLIRMGVWYDIVSALNTAENEVNVTIVNKRALQRFHCFRPIPQRERDLFPTELIQNPGY